MGDLWYLLQEFHQKQCRFQWKVPSEVMVFPVETVQVEPAQLRMEKIGIGILESIRAYKLDTFIIS